jgi:hypothetical protein
LRRSASVLLSIAKNTASLAVLHVEARDFAGARAWAAQVPQDAASFTVDGFWPQRSAWAAAYVYRACGENTLAEAWLRRGRALFEAQLAHLDAPQRETFSALPWHRNMLAAGAGQWPEGFW